MQDEGPSLRASFTCGHLSIDLTPRGSRALGLLCVDWGEHRSSLNNDLAAEPPSVASSPSCRRTREPALTRQRGWGVGMLTGGWGCPPGEGRRCSASWHGGAWSGLGRSWCAWCLDRAPRVTRHTSRR